MTPAERIGRFTKAMMNPQNGGVAPTGIPGLDTVLGGGLPRDRMYLFQGDPGVGKTTVGLQFLRTGADAGEKGLYVTLSETRTELIAVALSHGWSLDGVTIHELTPAGDLSAAEDNTLFQPSEVELGETTRAILAEIERVGPARLVIDSLAELRLLSQHPLRYRRQILALKQFFAGRRVTVMLLDDQTAPESELQLQSIAHGVVKMEQLAPLYGAERRRLRVMKLRGVKFRGGFHDMKIDTGLVSVYPRLVAAEHHTEFVAERTSTGIAGLDTLLGGGIDRGTTILLMGPAGTGKSAIAAQMLAAAAVRGEKAKFFAFEESLGTLFQRSRAIGIPIDEMTREGRLSVQQIDPAELSPGEFVDLVRAAVDDGARAVAIDSLNGYFSAMPEEHFLSLQLHELFSYLRQRGVTVVLTLAQHGFIGTMNTPVDVSYLADTVLLLRFFEAEGEIRKAISVPKKRAGPHENAIREFDLGSSGIRVGEPLRQFRGLLTGVPATMAGARVPHIGDSDDPARRSAR
jgi:circadian clock protein KaiC